MRVRLVVAPNGYSFTNQARSLEQGLLSLGVDAGIGSGFPHPEVVVGVGSWRGYEVLVTEPLRGKTVKVVPWILSVDHGPRRNKPRKNKNTSGSRRQRILAAPIAGRAQTHKRSLINSR